MKYRIKKDLVIKEGTVIDLKDDRPSFKELAYEIDTPFGRLKMTQEEFNQHLEKVK